MYSPRDVLPSSVRTEARPFAKLLYTPRLPASDLLGRILVR